MEDHLEEATYIGVLFIALVIACSIEAVALLRRDTRAVWTAAGITCAAAIGAYVWSRAIGLPQITDDVGYWTEPLAFVAVGAAAVACGLAFAALRRGRVSEPVGRGGVARPAVAGAALLAAGTAGTFVASSPESATSASSAR